MAYKEITQELTNFIDTNFRFPTRKDEIMADKTLPPMFLMLGVSTILVVGFIFALPILQWLPLGISLTALLIAGTSAQAAISKKAKRRLVLTEFERLWIIIPHKSEETRHLLLPLVAMKMENRRMSLAKLYEMDNASFDTVNLFKFYFISN